MFIQEINHLPWTEDFNRSKQPPLQRDEKPRDPAGAFITCHYLHVASFMSNHKGRGEAVLVVQSAAPQRVAHPRHRSVTWATEKIAQLQSSHLA